jgi:sirohydrochlorin cobaltochelatase
VGQTSDANRSFVTDSRQPTADSPTKQAVLILAHGSRDEAARVEYRRLSEAMASRVPEAPVQLSVLEFPGDDLASIPEGVERCVGTGAERIVALPYFLFAAGHVREDLPGELRQASESSGCVIAYQPPLGVDVRVLDVIEARAAEAASTLSNQPAGPTALLLVGAGTSDPDANSDLYRAARLLWERRRYDLVEVGFVSLTQPTVEEAVSRCRGLGARRILVVPYFLNTGTLSRRIAAKLETCRREWPELELVLGAELGLHSIILDLLADRARRGLESSNRDGLALPPCAQAGEAWACWLASKGPRYR